MRETKLRPHIVTLDSGVGGLSICQPLVRHWPEADFSYICDNGFFPYGTKSDAALRDRIKALALDLIVPMKPDIVVVACGTASTLALDTLRAHITAPVVGVVPAIKPAALLSKSKIIGLLATPGTVSRAYTLDLIQQFASGCEVLNVGSAALLAMAEAKLRGHPINFRDLQEAIRPVFVTRGAHRTDIIVLGCTHFPLIQGELENAAPWPVTWLEPGDSIVRRVDSLLDALSHQSQSQGLTTVRRQWLFTLEDTAARELESTVSERGFISSYAKVKALGR